MPHYEQWQKDFNKKSKPEREQYISDMKHEQRTFSAVDIAVQQLALDIPESSASRVDREKRKTLETQKDKLVKQATKQTQKQIQNTKFGFINWVVVILLVNLIAFTSKTALADSQTKRDETAKKVEQSKRSSQKSSRKRKHPKSRKVLQKLVLRQRHLLL